MKQRTMHLGPWRVERTLGRDMSGTYYAAHRDSGEHATLYLLSNDLATGDESLSRLLELHRDLDVPGLVRFHDLGHDGDDRYLIADAIDATLTPLSSSQRPAPGQIRTLAAALAAALAAGHDRGLVHGGLELNNTLWAPDRAPQILGTGVTALGTTDHVAMAYGDVAALGRLLCAVVASWQSRDAGGALLDRTAVDDRTIELIRLLADPSAAISMHEAHARLAFLLASDEQTRVERASAGIAGTPTAARGRPREPAAREARAPNNLAQATSSRFEGPAASVAGQGAMIPSGPEQPGGYLGRYRIVTRLGRGGMGEVFLADDPVLRRGVAIKRIRPGLEIDRTFRARLRREAQLAAHLSHRAIVQVFDLVTDANVDHVVMEYVPGPSLHTLLVGRAMAIPEVLRIAVELADGLDHAHQQGILHRDLKLENILISTDGQPKIADFGIGRRAGAGDRSTQDSLTREGMVLGTARAMSPEQAQGHDVDARSDLFSFGVMLYELVTGQSPFTAEVATMTIVRVMNDRQRPAIALVPEMPRALSDLIDHLLEKNPAQRPDSARTVRDRLRRILEEPAAPHSLPRARSPSLAEAIGRQQSTGDTPAANPARGKRRQVTLACIELAATSDASDDDPIDPELLADVLPAFRARVDEVVARFDGILISALGHRFVTCFGHPRPLEDAARRAVLAARTLLDVAAALRSFDPVHARTSFTATAAVHTGLAVAHGADELVLGATLDTALRLLQLGGAGDLWLSDAAARLVETDFQLERPPTPPAGMPSARRFIGVPSASASGEHDRPLVAREHELQLLLGSWRRARQGQGQVALIIGDPGIGKSRLVRELAAGVAGGEARHIVLRGSSHRQHSAFDPVTDVVAAMVGLEFGKKLDPTHDLAAATERVRALTGAQEAEQILHLLGCLANLPAAPPDRARRKLLEGLRDILVGSSNQAPILLVVEDLQWLDPSTLDLIALIIQDVAWLPVFLLMTTRPGLQPPWPATATITQYRLASLDTAAIDAVIAHACAGRALPAAERALIATRSGGVPLYAQELVRAALELGRTSEVPSTLRDALTARLHQLGSGATRVAHVAAVAGREFTAELVARASGLDRAAVDQELDRLVAAELLLRRRGLAREILYQFGHGLLQQAAYEELLAPDRRDLHGALADALLAEEAAGQDPGPELIAHHLAGARRFAEAIASVQRAALRVLGRHARVEARDLFRQALTWLEHLPRSDERDRTEISLRMQLGAVLIATEGYTSPELERSSRCIEALCERRDDMPMPVKVNLWAVRFMRGSLAEAEPLVGWFERVLARDAPPVERMMAHASIGVYACAHAEYDLARHHLERTMALFVPAEHASVVWDYGGCGGFDGHMVNTAVLWQTGRIDDAWRCARDMMTQVKTLDVHTVVTAVRWEMLLHIAVGDLARTEANAERILELSTRYNLPYPACWARCGLGWVRARRGQTEHALDELIAGNEGIKQIGIKVWYPYTLGLLADGAIALGQFAQAERAIDEAIEVCRTSLDRSNEPELLRLRGQLLLARDASAHLPARAAFAEALAVAQRHGALTSALRAATELSMLLREDHLADEAMAVLGPVYRGLPPAAGNPHLAAASELLAQLPAGAG
jgi:serine/threonine protein kinase/tetratricopeptide (TPR) repeat protein